MKETIIKSVLREPLSNDEVADLKNWLESSQTNQEVFNRLKTLELSEIILTIEDEELGHEMVNDFRMSIHAIRKHKRKSILSKIAYASSAAAILVLSFLVYDDFRDKRIDPTVSKEIASTNNTSGNKGIQLIIAGKMVDLDNADISEGKISIDRGKNQIAFQSCDTTLTAEFQPQMNTLIVPLKRECNLVLPDGSHVWVNSGSTLIFPEKFSDTLRSVELIGEAYFEITRNERAPFVVKTQNINTRVLGTEFMVSNYENKQEVALVNGSVVVNKNGSDKHIVLVPGRGVKLDKINSELTETNINKEQIIERKNGLIMFDEEKLLNITTDLENIYGVEFVFEAESLKNQTFYIKISRMENIQYIMQLLKYTKKIDYKIDNNKITIKKYAPMTN